LSGCGGKPASKNRMNKDLSNFAARLREAFFAGDDVRSLTSIGKIQNEPPHAGSNGNKFNEFALELFALQFEHNSAYKKVCEARKRTPRTVEHWTQIPFAPTGALKELELTSIEAKNRIAVFYSSGTTEQKPSRHFHCAESLALYEASLWQWFGQCICGNSESKIQNPELLILTPPPKLVPHSSLVHMFETIRNKFGRASAPASRTQFVGKISSDGAWTLDFDAALAALNSSLVASCPLLILGTAFSFIHLLDFLAERNLKFSLPVGSRVMETGGYKNRSRSLPKAELHKLISEFLGIPAKQIICEYGMSELSSQAYDSEINSLSSFFHHRVFHFPPWARAQIVSPETGCEVEDGKTGLIRVFDLANVFSVAAIQTEDLGIHRGNGFELIGRAQFSEPRGCSLMSV
jgi:Acyl-protein synthetase, LuxE